MSEPKMPAQWRAPQSRWKSLGPSALIAFLSLLFITAFFVSRQSTGGLDGIPFKTELIKDHFTHFEGHQECGITSRSLYQPPAVSAATHELSPAICPNRQHLLTALTSGGRRGFDAPFFPSKCHYRWFTTTEICMILERFDSVIFVGDDPVKHIYTAFNVLLRENVALGGMKQWEMEDEERRKCKCENQFVREECGKFLLRSNEEVGTKDTGSKGSSPYYCNRIPHRYIPLTRSPAPADTLSEFKKTFAPFEAQSYKPIPLIYSLSLSTSLSYQTGTASMDEILSLALETEKNVPTVFLGPTAAGHLKPPGKILNEGNNAVWHYSTQMESEARKRGMDFLGMYNATLQAGSWDGSFYGESWNLVAAMMVVNWLSRLEST